MLTGEKSDFDLKDSQYEIVEIPAFGVYDDIIYDFYPNEILLFFYFDMLKRVKKNDVIMIDVNTGLNEYVNLLISALLYFIVTLSLENIMDQKTIKTIKTINAYEIITEPITGKDNNHIHNIYINEFERKIFFSLPYTSGNFQISTIMEMDDSSKREFESTFKYRKDYSRILKNINIIFNAISNNTLPFLYEIKAEIDEKTKQAINSIIDDILKNVGNEIKPAENKRGKKIVNSQSLINFIMTLKIYYGIIGLLHDNDIIDDLHDLDKMYDAAGEIYGNGYINLKMNERFLSRDIIELKKLTEPDHNSISGKNNKTGDEERNFFAHSGMEHNAININNGKIEYKKEYIDKIKKWLLGP